MEPKATTSNSLKTRVVTAQSSNDEENRYRDRIVTVPNIICAARLVGAFSLFFLAFANNLPYFVVIFVVLNLSDWIDGRLARWLNQRSDFGARLDSFADAILYGGLLFGMLWMRWDVLALLRGESL